LIAPDLFICAPPRPPPLTHHFSHTLFSRHC